MQQANTTEHDQWLTMYAPMMINAYKLQNGLAALSLLSFPPTPSLSAPGAISVPISPPLAPINDSNASSSSSAATTRPCSPTTMRSGGANLLPDQRVCFMDPEKIVSIF